MEMKRIKMLFCKHNRKHIQREYISLSDSYKCSKCWKCKYVYNAECHDVDLHTIEIIQKKN